MATRKIFKVNQLPPRYNDHDIAEVSIIWKHQREYLCLIVDTHQEGISNADRIESTGRWTKG